MAIEILKEAFQNIGGKFGQVTAPAGKTSVWAIKDGQSEGGFLSARDLLDKGLPFGGGDRRIVTGFEVAKVGESKDRKDNVCEGPSGRKYVELHIDSKDLAERTAFEASIGNARVDQEKAAAARNQNSEFIKRSNLIQENVATQQLHAASY